MANICFTELVFTATPEAVNWLHSEIRKIMDENENEHRQKVFDMFADEYDPNSKSLGSRTVFIYECDVLDNEMELKCESDWKSPSIMIKSITKMLQEKSDDFPVVAKGTYWGQGIKFAGIIKCDKDGYRYAETNVTMDYDEDDENFDFYEHLLYPTINRLSID